MSAPTVPIIVVAGFLGSGKTTLLNHVLNVAAGSLGVRIGVLVNDFGAINIDAMLVAGQADGAVSLTNGCMCCSVERDGLEVALGTLLNPAAGIDAIVVEASGIADPKSLIRLVTTAADRRMRYGGLVYVIDGVGFDALRVAHPEIETHVAVADLVVINKADLTGPADRARIDAVVDALNPTAARIAVAHAQVDPALLVDPVTRTPGRGDDDPRQLTLDDILATETTVHDHHGSAGESPRGHAHLHDHYTAVEFVTDEAMDPRRLAAFLERPPRGCYRIKGVTWFDRPGHRQQYIVHGVGGFVGVERRAWSGQPRATSIVVIGIDMDADQVRAELRAAVGTTESRADDHGILHITRHLPGA